MCSSDLDTIVSSLAETLSELLTKWEKKENDEARVLFLLKSKEFNNLSKEKILVEHPNISDLLTRLNKLKNEQSSPEFLRSIPEESLRCTISLDFIDKTAVLAPCCKALYEKKEIETWLVEHKSCCACKASLTKDKIGRAHV